MKNPNKFFALAEIYRAEYEAETRQPGGNRAYDFLFAQIPHVVLRSHQLSDGARLFWGYLHSRCGDHKWVCWPSLETMSQDIGFSVSKVHRLLKELEASGFLEISKYGKSYGAAQPNSYTLKHPREVTGNEPLKDTWAFYDWIRKRHPGLSDAEMVAPFPDVAKSFPEMGAPFAVVTMEEDPGEEEPCEEEPVNNNTPLRGKVVVVSPTEPQPTDRTLLVDKLTNQVLEDLPTGGGTKEIRSLVSGVFKQEGELIQEPGEGSGFRRLVAHEQRIQREERKTARAHAKVYAQQERERAILDGTIEAQKPPVRLAEAFRGAMVKGGMQCFKASPKDLAIWGSVIERVGGDYAVAEKMVLHTVTNWKQLQGRYPKLTGEPGPQLFLSAWALTLAKESAGTAQASVHREYAPSNPQWAETTRYDSPRQEARYQMAGKLAELLLLEKKGEPHDSVLREKLMFDNPHTGYLTEHLTRLGFYEFTRK